MMILPSGLAPSFETREYLKNRAAESWHHFFHQAIEAGDENLQELFEKRSVMFLHMDNMLAEMIEFSLSESFVRRAREGDLYHYPIIFAKIFSLMAKKRGWSSQDEFDFITRKGKFLWVSVFEASTDRALLIEALKNYFAYLKMDSLMSIVFLGSVLTEKNLWQFYDLTAQKGFPIAWLPTLFALIPGASTLVSLEGALESLVHKNGDFKMDELLANPDSAYYLLKVRALASLQKDQAPLLNQYLPSIVKGMMTLLKDPDFRQEDLSVYNHLVVVYFFSIEDVQKRCDLLKDYVENLGVLEPDWPAIVAKVFNQITDPGQRRDFFVSMARVEGFPESWKTAYYLIADVDQTFEDVIAEWEQAKYLLDFSCDDAAAVKFFVQVLERALPRSLEKWALRSWQDPQWRGEWEAQQKLIAYVWDILCEADWKLWSPLAKEYYLGVFLGYPQNNLDPVNVLTFQSVEMSFAGHKRLMRLLTARKKACSDQESEVLKTLLGYQLPIDQWSPLIAECVSKIENDSAEILKAFMKRCYAIFFENNTKPCFRQQLWLHLASVLLERGKEAGLQLLLQERILENWPGKLPKGLQSLFQHAAESRKVIVSVLLSVYQMMGPIPFKDTRATLKALEYVRVNVGLYRIPVGSLQKVLEILFGDKSPFNRHEIDRAGKVLFSDCASRVGCFVPQSKEELIQVLCGLLDRSLHRRFQGLYPLLRSLCIRFRLDPATEIERIFSEFQLMIQGELLVFLKQNQEIPAELRKKICPHGEPFAKQVTKLYLEALLTGKDS